jgi:hypothetical protein
VWGGTLWTILGLVVIAIVLLLFVADALSERTPGARIAAFITVAAGVAQGGELWRPWLPLGLLASAIAFYIVGNRRSPREAKPR